MRASDVGTRHLLGVGMLSLDPPRKAFMSMAVYAGIHLIEGETVASIHAESGASGHRSAFLGLDVGRSRSHSCCTHAHYYQNRP